MPHDSAWIRRFTATTLGLPTWSAAEPDRLALITNRSGASQAWAVDLSTGGWRQASDERVGVEEVLVDPLGRLVWFQDDSGDETGRWVAQAFDGGEPLPLAADLPPGWSTGLSMVGSCVAAGLEMDGEYGVYAADSGGPPRLLYKSSTPSGVGTEWPAGAGGLSPDGRLLCIRHTEQGDLLRGALRVFDVVSGDIVGDLVDAGRRLDAGPWISDTLLSITSERGSFERPGLWDLSSGERTDLEIDLPGAVFPVDGFPVGRALLVRHEHEGRAQLFRLDIDTGGIDPASDRMGDIEDARVRPDGEVWLRASDSVRPPRILAADGREVLPSPDDPPPEGRRYRSFFFDNPHGQRIQSFVVTPSGDGPFPTVMSVHGGPEWHERDRFDPETQAFVDVGYAVALINYRGSTGYGVAFREALIGNPCFPESEDVVACLDALVREGVADVERVYWSGWSWGGCLACLNEGLNPDRWRAVFAGIPAGDMVAAHWASAPELQAWDDAVYGGDPNQVPEMYRERDPMTYVDRAKAPVLIIAGENDPRCPIEGITPWVDAVRARGIEVDVDLYPAGHHTNASSEQVRHMQLILDFFARHS